MQQLQAMSDLDMLMDYEKDARIASVGYLSTATEAHDPELKKIFLDFSNGAVKHHGQFMEMIRKMGGEA